MGEEVLERVPEPGLELEPAPEPELAEEVVPPGRKVPH